MKRSLSYALLAATAVVLLPTEAMALSTATQMGDVFAKVTALISGEFYPAIAAGGVSYGLFHVVKNQSFVPVLTIGGSLAFVQLIKSWAEKAFALTIGG